MTTIEKIAEVLCEYIDKCWGVNVEREEVAKLVTTVLHSAAPGVPKLAAEEWLRDETVHTAEGWKAAEEIAAELDCLRIELLRTRDVTLNLVAEAAYMEAVMLRNNLLGHGQRTSSIRQAIEDAIATDTTVSSRLPEATELSSQLAILRDAGWTVAVHNDYRVTGQKRTFWLFTHENGQWLKGEGETDEMALDQCLVKMRDRI